MKRLTWLTLVAPLSIACGGPSDGGQGVKTPDELVAEQERLADEQAAESEKHQGTSGSELRRRPSQSAPTAH